jgi:hypothetical protein
MISSFLSTCGDGCCIKIANSDYKKKKKKWIWQKSIATMFFFTNFRTNNKIQPKIWNEAQNLKKFELKNKTNSHQNSLSICCNSTNVQT